VSNTAWETLSNQAVGMAGIVYFIALIVHLAEWASLRQPARDRELVGAGAMAALLQQIGEQRLGLARRAARRVPVHLAAIIAIDPQPAEAADLPAVAAVEMNRDRLFRRAAQQPHRVGAFGGMQRRRRGADSQLRRDRAEPEIDLLA